MKIVILGAGLMGKAMALDLLADKRFEVSAIDWRKEPLTELQAKGLVSVSQKDLSNPDEVRESIQPYDLVINAVPGSLGFKVLKACVEEGKKVVDITFSPEDHMKLDNLAKAKRTTAIVDCGVAPGLSNILAAYALTQMDKGLSLTIYVGGLPVVRTWPFEYKTVFSPADVIEEYLRPARYKENGQVKVQPALSEPEFIEFEGLGTLEAFNTDGLRTLLETLPYPNMKEKTLRYPGHREKMAILKEAGFFDSEPLIVAGKEIIPQEVTCQLLFSRLKLQAGEEDFTVMRVIASGIKEGRPLTLNFELFDRFDLATGVHSMARTTGYTATMIARALAEGLVEQQGIIPPEFLGFNKQCYAFILRGLEERGIRIKTKIWS